MNIIEFENINCAYERGKDVLHGVNFSVESGQVVGLLGKNGAGKTTLLRAAMGLLDLQQGSISLFGMDPRRQPLEVKQRVGYVSEEQILPPFLRVGEVMKLHRQLYPTWEQGMAEELRDRFGLDPQAKIKTLSKGQARQVALICAIAHLPELLILDEPAGGLDPLARREFLETSIQLLNKTGTTILFSSHYMTDVERLADRVVLIHEGRVLVDSCLDDVSENHSIARVPYDRGATLESLHAMEECLGVRERADALHAVFRLDPLQSQDMLTRRMGIADAHCHNAALEEMFIELVGGQP